MGKTINGKEIREHTLRGIAAQVEQLKSKGINPRLAVILVGDDPASKIYVSNKKKSCESVGIESLEYTLPAETTTEQLLALIDELNADASVNGFICQLPVPRHIDKGAVLERIRPDKDVDCFHPVNVGLLSQGKAQLMPCTPAGIIKMLEYEQLDLAGKHCVVIGRSDIVGKPMAMLMLQKNATVTVCHSATEDLPAVTRTADILIAAVGKPKFVTADMVKPGAVVIDVGMDRDENGKLCGDVDFDSVIDKASLVTPVPGGVGLMTTAMLMHNTVTAARLQHNLA